MSEEEKSFRERLGNDVKKIKGMLYKEELMSFVFALIFAFNLAAFVVLPLGWNIINLLAALYTFKMCFKPTVKKQEVLHLHLKFLKTIKDEKVWTQGDKK